MFAFPRSLVLVAAALAASAFAGCDGSKATPTKSYEHKWPTPEKVGQPTVVRIRPAAGAAADPRDAQVKPRLEKWMGDPEGRSESAGGPDGLNLNVVPDDVAKVLLDIEYEPAPAGGMRYHIRLIDRETKAILFATHRDEAALPALPETADEKALDARAKRLVPPDLGKVVASVKAGKEGSLYCDYSIVGGSYSGRVYAARPDAGRGKRRVHLTTAGELDLRPGQAKRLESRDQLDVQQHLVYWLTQALFRDGSDLTADPADADALASASMAVASTGEKFTRKQNGVVVESADAIALTAEIRVVRARDRGEVYAKTFRVETPGSFVAFESGTNPQSAVVKETVGLFASRWREAGQVSDGVVAAVRGVKAE